MDICPFLEKSFWNQPIAPAFKLKKIEDIKVFHSAFLQFHFLCVRDYEVKHELLVENDMVLT